MSVHSCNELCNIDERFHEIQKYEGESESWYASRDEMKDFLLKRIKKDMDLIEKLT